MSTADLGGEKHSSPKSASDPGVKPAPLTKRRGLSCVETNFVCPGSHRREVAGWIVTSHMVNTGVGGEPGENGADNVEDLWFEVGQEQGSVARQHGRQLAHVGSDAHCYCYDSMNTFESEFIRGRLGSNCTHLEIGPKVAPS